jgi:predicted nucleotidyltransferase
MTETLKLDFIIEELGRLLPILTDRYAVDSLGVFGSYVRGEPDSGSDLDILVTFRETPGLLRYIELENFLSDRLSVKVDLVMRDALKPVIGERILSEVVLI